jgi:predicted ester cyclase
MRMLISILLPALVLLSSGCKNTKSAEAVTHSDSNVPANSGADQEFQTNKEVLLRAHREVWTKGNLDVVKELYDENFVCYYNGDAGWKGIEGLKATVTSWRADFPDWRENVQQIVAEGDLVVTRWISSGTYRGSKHPEFAGKKVAVWEMSVRRFKTWEDCRAVGGGGF